MFETNIRKVGNSRVVTLPTALLERLRAQEGDKLYIEEQEDGSFKLTRHDPVTVRQIKASAQIMDEHADIMAALA